MRLFVKRLTETAILPRKDRPDDEGWDIFADENIIIKKGQVTKISTGIACIIEDETKTINCHDTNRNHWQEEKIINQYWLQIEGRSGLAAKGIFPVGGVLDLNYRGEIGVMLANLSVEGFSVGKGDKIAQLVVRKHYDPAIKEVQELDETDRGDKGFGSSGMK